MKNDKWGGSSSSSDLTEEPTDISVRFSRGVDLLRLSEVNEAQQVFEDVINENAEYAPAHFGLGCVFVRLDRKDTAEAEFQRAIELDPHYGEAHYALAWLKYDANDLEAGYEHVKKVMESTTSIDSVREHVELLMGTGDTKPVGVESEDLPVLDTKRKVTLDSQETAVSETFGSEVLARLKSTVLSYAFVQELLANERRLLLTLFVFSFIIRILYWIFIFPLDFWIDSYHHWQISFFSLKVGFPTRGWFYDPGGWVYMWMPLPHLVQMVLLLINKSLTPMRLLNCILGSLSVLMTYLIGIKVSNRNVALLSSFCLSIFSVTLIHDVIGGIEPLTTFLLLAAIYSYLEGHYFSSGLFWGLTSLCRTEFWLIGVAIVTITYLSGDMKSLNNIQPYLGYAIIYFIAGYFYGRRGVSFFSLIKSPFISVSSQFFSLLNTNIFYPILIVIAFIAFIYVIKLIKELPIYPIFVVALIHSGYMVVTQLRYIKGTNVLLDIKNFILLSNSKFNIGPFRYSTMGIPFIFLTISHLVFIPNNKKLKRIGVSAILLVVLLTTIPILSLYRPYENIPVKYMEAADFIGAIYEGEEILCDNQMINYRLAQNNIPASNIRGSWQFKDVIDLERGNVTLFIMTSITWDGAHVLYYKTNHTRFNLIYEQDVIHIRLPWFTETVYVYRIDY